MNIYKIPWCLERTFIVHNYFVEKNRQNILNQIDSHNFNPARTIILEKEPIAKLALSENSIYNDKAEITKYEPDEIKIAAESEEDGMLFLSEIYYPGWEAYIDGAKTEIYRANYLFRAIELPKGAHAIKFAYNPRIFKLGATISATTLLFTIVSLLYLSIRKR